MKIAYPMQLGEGNNPTEVASLDEFIDKLAGCAGGAFLVGRNRIWHGGVHLSEKGGWHSSGAVRVIADGEIVAYRLAKQPAKATLKPEQGQPGEAIELFTSPSFCLVRHHYEAGEQAKNACTFYSLYMHIACENTYCGPEAARLVVKGRSVSTYEPALERVNELQYRLRRRVKQQGEQSEPVYALEGAEVKLANPGSPASEYLNHKDETHAYHLVSYVNDPGNLFYIAASQLQAVLPTKPAWMTPPAGKPARHQVPNNSWLRQTATTSAGSLGLPAGSEVVVSDEPQMVNLSGGPTEFRQVQVFKAGSGTVKDSANRVMTNASSGSVGWLAASRLGAALAAEPSTPIEFDKVEDRSQKPIAVTAGETIGHWGEHQTASAGAHGFVIEPDRKAVHFEVFVAESDKSALEDCIKNKARLTSGQGYLLLKAGEVVITYRLTSDAQHGYHNLAQFGPLVLPLAVKESDIVSHGANNFVKVRERTAAEGELAGEYVLLSGDTQLISQHDWAKLGVKQVDGSNDPDGFLDKAGSEGQEGGEFFSGIYKQLVTADDANDTLSGNEIRSALAEETLAGKVRQLFIKHESEWIKRESWPRLEQELVGKPNLYKYAMQVHKNMAWIEEASAILGDSKPWFIHPAGMMGLVGEANKSNACDCRTIYANKFKVTRYGSQYGPVYWGEITLGSYSGWGSLITAGRITEDEKAILVAMSDNEGKMDSIQSYDSEVITAGAMQKTFKDGRNREGKGELSEQLAKFRDKHPELYSNHMLNCGWSVEGDGSSAITYYSDLSLTNGNKITSIELKTLIREGCNASTFGQVINNIPLAALLKVISLPEYLDIQILDFIDRLHIAGNHIVMFESVRIKDYIKSNFGRAVILDHSVNRPGFVKDNFKTAIDNFHIANPNVSLNPHDWGSQHEIYEAKLLEEYKLTRNMTDSINRYDSLRSKF
jgi:hypothetical protein